MLNPFIELVGAAAEGASRGNSARLAADGRVLELADETLDGMGGKRPPDVAHSRRMATVVEKAARSCAVKIGKGVNRAALLPVRLPLRSQRQ